MTNVDIILPTYNCEKYIEETMDSIIRQSFTNWKLMIIDDGSKDNTPLLINKYGIPEPDSANKVYPDILIVPLVAYDKELNRLGYGGGFFDRYISNIQKVSKSINIVTVIRVTSLKYCKIRIQFQGECTTII